MILPLALIFPSRFPLFSLSLYLCVCAYACVCIHKLTTLHREKEKSEGEKVMIVLRASILWCVFLHLFLSFCFFVSLSVCSSFLSGPVEGQADQSGRSLLWCASQPPFVSGLMTNGSKINTLTKESLQVTNCS